MLAMELQLGLALPIHSPMVKGLDLNRLRFENDQSECARAKGKRGFDEAFEEIGEHCPSPKKLVSDLLVWRGQPNDGDDDDKGHNKNDSCPINKIGADEENYIIGWPPIKSSRRKEVFQRPGTWRRRDFMRSTAPIKVNRSSSSSYSLPSNNSMYVKVKMEGVAIARKVDLSVHRSYHTLKHTLLSMFSNYDQECVKNSKRYTLTYQDKEGDWLLAGDVPWKSFIKSVQRLEIVRN